MTTKELIKALQVCADHETSCLGCAFWGTDGGCLTNILAAAADRLEELAAENEQLKRKATEDLEDWVDD